MPGTRWSSTARSTSCRCCHPGIVRGGKLSVIGNGVVLDPWHLVEEIAKLRGQGVEISPENLMIAENTPLILPIHGELDRAREAQGSVAKIGTTGRGIGPAYEDKVGRRVGAGRDLADAATLELRVDRALVHHDALRRGLGMEPVDRDALDREAARYRARSAEIRRPRLEGAQRSAQAQANGFCSKARRARFWISTLAPIRSSPPRT